jgi:hypothetical protein
MKKLRNDKQIKKLREQGLSFGEISKVIGLSRTAVRRSLLAQAVEIIPHKIPKEKRALNSTTHGMKFTAEYRAWQNMKNRCLNKNTTQYKDYGGRGIEVCSEWLECFENFFKDMGKKPSEKHSIDRIDNNGNYEPSNCRWSTRSEQNSNTRQNNFFEYKGAIKTITQWSECLGVTQKVLRNRIKRNKDIDVLFGGANDNNT